MGDYFKSLLESPSNKLPVSPQPGYASNDILHAPISNDEIKTVLQSLKRNKAPGVEGLPPIAFKLFNNQLIKPWFLYSTKFWRMKLTLKHGALV